MPDEERFESEPYGEMVISFFDGSEVRVPTRMHWRRVGSGGSGQREHQFSLSYDRQLLELGHWGAYHQRSGVTYYPLANVRGYWREQDGKAGL